MNFKSLPADGEFPFDAVVFDCDGVLVDSEAISIDGERHALKLFGLDYTPAEYVRRFVGLHDGAYFDELRSDFETKLGFLAPDDLEDKVLAGRRRDAHLLAPIEGAGLALHAARRRSGRIAVASSSRAEFLERKLRRTELWEIAAPHIYSADFVPRGKPAPDIFLYAAEKIGVRPERCLVIEDSENGVRAGVAAGMVVWGFLGGGHIFEGHGERLQAAGATAVVQDFREFISVISA